jgi:hypothetical protein
MDVIKCPGVISIGCYCQPLSAPTQTSHELGPLGRKGKMVLGRLGNLANLAKLRLLVLSLHSGSTSMETNDAEPLQATKS